MCGIAGIIYKNGDGGHRVGRDMTRMLQSMKHRGPDSTGYALYRAPTHDIVLRFKLADANDPARLRLGRGPAPPPPPGRGAGCAPRAPRS